MPEVIDIADTDDEVEEMEQGLVRFAEQEVGHQDDDEPYEDLIASLQYEVVGEPELQQEPQPEEMDMEDPADDTDWDEILTLPQEVEEVAAAQPANAREVKSSVDFLLYLLNNI